MLRRLLKSLMLDPPVDEEVNELARFQIPANAATLRPISPHAPTYPRSKSVLRYEGKSAIMRRLDGHPDLHHYLWEEAGAEIPRECCWVIQATAAFANPETNIIFATVGGTHDLRIRLSDEHALSFADYDATPISGHSGFRWVSSSLKIEDDRAMLAMAYKDSGIMQQDNGKASETPAG